MKCSIMRHFIWVLTGCQSICLGVSGLQRDMYEINTLEQWQPHSSWVHNHSSVSHSRSAQTVHVYSAAGCYSLSGKNDSWKTVLTES